MKEKDKNKKTVDSYNKGAEFYAKEFDSYNSRSNDIDRAFILNRSGSDKLLELGCGNGRDAEYIISKVGKSNYVGIDASEELINLAKGKVPQGKFHVKDMREIDFDTETFGIVFSFASMLHVNREELRELLKKCYKWLKIGGILYISTKYGKYRELKIQNLGEEKYYYPYESEDILKLKEDNFEVLYNTIGDTDYGPMFTIALRKTKE